MHFKITIFTYKKWSRKKKIFFRDPFLKKSLVENNSYIYVYDFPQKKFSMCHGTYSPIPDSSKNWSVKKNGSFGRGNILFIFRILEYCAAMRHFLVTNVKTEDDLRP